MYKRQTYYYERTFWNISGTSASQASRIVSFDSSAVESIDGYISDTGDGHAQFSQGTPRMTYINELHNDKSSNATKTATSFINPKWSGNQVFVWLGNNGKLSLPEPGSLEVSKTCLLYTSKSQATGTTITFWPDDEIFETTVYSFDTLHDRLQEMALSLIHI